MLNGCGLDDDGLSLSLALHLHSDQLQLRGGQLDRDLLYLAVAVDDLLHDLDSPWLGHLLLHLLLQLNHLWLCLPSSHTQHTSQCRHRGKCSRDFWRQPLPTHSTVERVYRSKF